MRRRSVEFKAAERRDRRAPGVATRERTADDAEAARVHMLKVLIAAPKFRRVLKPRRWGRSGQGGVPPQGGALVPRAGRRVGGRAFGRRWEGAYATCTRSR